MRAVLAVAAGGVLGALARAGATALLPGFPTVVAVNLAGCFLIGVVMTFTDHAVTRAFWGVGVLGGFTTFSTAMTDVQVLLSSGHVTVGLLVWVGTVVLGVVAAGLGVATTKVVRR